MKEKALVSHYFDYNELFAYLCTKPSIFKHWVHLCFSYCVIFSDAKFRASRCIWARRKPGNVKKAPISEHRTARNNLKVSLDTGPLKNKKRNNHCVEYSQKLCSTLHISSINQNKCPQPPTTKQTAFRCSRAVFLQLARILALSLEWLAILQIHQLQMKTRKSPWLCTLKKKSQKTLVHWKAGTVF